MKMESVVFDYDVQLETKRCNVLDGPRSVFFPCRSHDVKTAYEPDVDVFLIPY